MTQDGERREDDKISKKRDGEGRDGERGGEGVKLKKGRGKRSTRMGWRRKREERYKGNWIEGEEERDGFTLHQLEWKM